MSEVTLTKLSSKGQIVIPKSLRTLLSLKSGEVFAVFGEGDTIILKKLSPPIRKRITRTSELGKGVRQEKGNLENGCS